MTHRTISVNHKKKGGGGREKDLRSSSSNTHTFQQVTYLQKTGLQGSELSSGDILKKKKRRRKMPGEHSTTTLSARLYTCQTRKKQLQ